MKVYAWLIDFAHFRENCSMGIISEWMYEVTQHNGIIQYYSYEILRVKDLFTHDCLHVHGDYRSHIQQVNCRQAWCGLHGVLYMDFFSPISQNNLNKDHLPIHKIVNYAHSFGWLLYTIITYCNTVIMMIAFRGSADGLFLMRSRTVWLPFPILFDLYAELYMFDKHTYHEREQISNLMQNVMFIIGSTCLFFPISHFPFPISHFPFPISHFPFSTSAIGLYAIIHCWVW